MAIGATRRDVLRLQLAGGVRVAAIGLLVGLPLAIAAAVGLQSVLWGVSAWSPRIWLTVPPLLTAAVLLASYLPARRASLTDPSSALRQD